MQLVLLQLDPEAAVFGNTAVQDDSAKVADCLKITVVPSEDEVLSWATRVAMNQSVHAAIAPIAGAVGASNWALANTAPRIRFQEFDYHFWDEELASPAIDIAVEYDVY